MNFKEIETRLLENGIFPKMIADDFEQWIDQYQDDNKYSINIFGQEIREESLNALFEKMKIMFKQEFGDYTVKQKRHNEYAESVVHFKDHDVYVLIQGWYSSYAGSNFDDATYQECRPVEVTTIEYKPISLL